MARRRQSGLSLVLAALLLCAAAAATIFAQVTAHAAASQRERITERALAQAREALISYAADRPITAAVGPGYLPCPDLDDDGWAESTCGSLAGDRGQAERLGRLPWKTLGLPDLRDGAGERLWYAVSTRHQGQLNCAASAACVDMSPAAALGTITVRSPMGDVLHDGTSLEPARGGAAAVVMAPGAPLARRASATRAERGQARECAPGDCDPAGRCVTDPPQRAARCDPGNYLDIAPVARSGEDNADFIDRSDAGRGANGNGFIQGPVSDGAGQVVVNDRLLAIGWSDLMPRVTRRVAQELAHCLSSYAALPENRGRLPAPTPACPGAAPAYGRIPDTPFPRATDNGMLERWWRAQPRSPEALAELPTQARACRIAVAPADEGTARTMPPASPANEGETAGVAFHSWWTAWKPFVLYAPAPALLPGASAAACDGSQACLELRDAGGRLLGAHRRAALVVARRPAECGSARLQCEPGGCVGVSLPGGERDAEAVLALQ